MSVRISERIPDHEWRERGFTISQDGARVISGKFRYNNTNGLQIAPPIVLHSYIIRESPVALFSILLFNIQTTYLSLLSIFSRASRIPLCAEFWKPLIDVRFLIRTYHIGCSIYFFIDTAEGLVRLWASFFITYRFIEVDPRRGEVSIGW